MNKISEIEGRFDEEFPNLLDGEESSRRSDKNPYIVRANIKSFYHKEIEALVEGLAKEVESKIRILPSVKFTDTRGKLIKFNKGIKKATHLIRSHIK